MPQLHPLWIRNECLEMDCDRGGGSPGGEVKPDTAGQESFAAFGCHSKA